MKVRWCRSARRWGPRSASGARLTARNIRTLVACGAAGGVAATFNAPIAGAIFAMEVLVGRIQTDFLLVLLTSLSSSIIARHYLGDDPAVHAPAYYLISPGELPLYFIMGIVVGLAAVSYVRLLYASEDFFGKWNFPEHLKPAVGGLVVGLILRYFPEVYGSGFPAIESALWTRYTWSLLLCLFAMEMLANCATLGSGGSGRRVRTGALYGRHAGRRFRSSRPLRISGLDATSGAYAMVGMAAFFAAAAKAPTTSILILFEMTGDYHIMLPLMAATVGSVYLSHRLMRTASIF